MPLTAAFQMDHIAGLHIAGDSTFALMLEAQARGHAMVHFTPDTLAMRDGRVVARAEPVEEVRDTEGAHFRLGAAAEVDLATTDVVMLRQDPPFDMGYITSTHLLERLHPATLVVNDPGHVRNAPEKLFVTEFADLTPPTLITRDRQQIIDFRAAHDDIIIKPLYGNGGAGVFRIAGGDENLSALLEMFETAFREPFVVQRYLPEVRAGDKRIILVDGEPVGAINRIPALGESRSNMHVGGRPEPIGLSARDREICDRLGPTLQERGLIFVGIDVIGEWLTEINVTSPTGIREVQRFGGADIAALIWDAVEARRA
ncbi:MAG: glutathione synthase [Alphaproteobacteria bacterium]